MISDKLKCNYPLMIYLQQKKKKSTSECINGLCSMQANTIKEKWLIKYKIKGNLSLYQLMMEIIIQKSK